MKSESMPLSCGSFLYQHRKLVNLWISVGVVYCGFGWKLNWKASVLVAKMLSSLLVSVTGNSMVWWEYFPWTFVKTIPNAELNRTHILRASDRYLDRQLIKMNTIRWTDTAFGIQPTFINKCYPCIIELTFPTPEDDVRSFHYLLY